LPAAKTGYRQRWRRRPARFCRIRASGPGGIAGRLQADRARVFATRCRKRRRKAGRPERPGRVLGSMPNPQASPRRLDIRVHAAEPLPGASAGDFWAFG
jgi:hypothetical protein